MSTETQDWEQTKELFHAALELRPDARLRFLEQNSSSPEVRASVEQLLQAHEAADSLDRKSVV